MPKNRGPKNTWAQQRKLAMQRLGKKRLSPTRPQRIVQRAAMNRLMGYNIPKLSQIVGKPGNYTVQKRVIQYDVKTEQQPSESILVGYEHPNIYGMERKIYKRVPGKTIIVGKKAIGERLIIRKHHKTGQRKGSGSADRNIIHKTGTMKARKSAKVGGKIGMRTGRELKKKPKKTD